MLKKRVIPTILYDGTAQVKGRAFASDRVVGSVLQAARVYERRAVDELCFLDVGATRDGRGPNLEIVSALASQVFMPFSVGGGVRSVDDVHELLRHGADKVVVGTGGTALVRAIAERYGCQAVVASVDVRQGHAVYVECGRREVVGVTPETYAAQLVEAGVGELLLQSIDRDGTRQGYDLDLIARIAPHVSVPVIASGGCSGPADMVRAFMAGADAVAVGALFLFDDVTPLDCKRELAAHGIPVRL